MCKFATAVAAFAAWLAPASVSDAQVSCQQIGNQTHCSNGQIFQRYGNITYDGQGRSWQQFGNQTYGSDGTAYQRLGNQTFDGQGNSWQQFGDQTFGSDGSMCQRIGTMVFCN